MRRALLLLFIGTPLFAQQQQAVAAARGSWSSAHDFIVRSGEMVSDADFAFRPVATVRTFGQIVAHVADDEMGWCAQVLGEPMKETGFEKTLRTKADILKAIRDAGTYCAKAYAISDADAARMTTIWGGRQARIQGLVDNASHDWEHYGNIVTYLRIKGLVPPSSSGSGR